MANNPHVNKVEYAGQTIIDLTGDTATESDVLNGKTFHLKTGAQGTGNVITHDVYDGLDSNSASDALSAKQGNILNPKKNTELTSSNVTSDTFILSLQNGVYQVADNSLNTNYIPEKFGTLLVDVTGRAYGCYIFISTGENLYIRHRIDSSSWHDSWKKISTLGTVTSVGTGSGLTGGPVTSSGTLKVDLTSETKLSNAAADATETSGRVYPVRLDKNGKLAVNVPWVNTDHKVTFVDINITNDTGIQVNSATGGAVSINNYAGAFVIDSNSITVVSYTYSNLIYIKLKNVETMTNASAGNYKVRVLYYS